MDPPLPAQGGTASRLAADLGVVAMSDRMTCVSCGRSKAWPDGFPSRIEATCWQCAWDRHIHDAHPRIVRRIRRDARKRARRIKARDVEAAMFEAEKRQALGIDYEAEAQAAIPRIIERLREEG